MPSAVRREGVRVFHVIALLALASGVSGCWEGTTRETLATVFSLEGKAEISSDGGRTFHPLQLSDHPGKRARLRTTPGAHVALAPLANSFVQVEGDTSVEIVRIALTKDGNETGSDIRGRNVDLWVPNGRILAWHTWGEAIARFTVATPHGELTVSSNALLWLEVDSARTRVTCASGSAGFRAKGGSTATRIGSGFVAESSGANVNLTPADADAQAQENVVEALELEQKLVGLTAGHRNALPR